MTHNKGRIAAAFFHQSADSAPHYCWELPPFLCLEPELELPDPLVLDALPLPWLPLAAPVLPGSLLPLVPDPPAPAVPVVSPPPPVPLVVPAVEPPPPAVEPVP